MNLLFPAIRSVQIFFVGLTTLLEGGQCPTTPSHYGSIMFIARIFNIAAIEGKF